MLLCKDMLFALLFLGEASPCVVGRLHVLSPKAVFRKSLANFARLSADAVQIDSWVLHLEGEYLPATHKTYHL